MNSKKEAFQDFFEWLYDDNRIENNSVKLHSEIDLSLAHTYSDANIYYPTQFEDFFETKAMSRLGRISQLGLAVTHFPNLYHNRLEHSKGVLNKKIEELFYNYQNPSWKKYIEENNLKLHLIAELIKMAGHDIGHPPLSHAMEEQIFGSRGVHEEIGNRIMLENKDIQNVLLSISPELPSILAELYEKDFLNFKNHDESSYDVDRMDYLSRDSLYLGYNLNLTTQNYESICVETDENNIPICNSDNSIKTNNLGKTYIDVYDFSSLPEIEKALLLREDRYKDVYMSKYVHSAERCISRFLEAFLSSPSEYAGSDFKEFLTYLKSTEVEDIDLDKFIEFDEIQLYSKLLNIAEKHENTNIQLLATMIIPNMDAFLNLLYSHLKVYSDKKDFTESDKEFLKRIKQLIKSDSTLACNLKDKDFLDKNTLVFPEDVEFPYDEALLTDRKIKIKSYKKSEPIYIKDNTGKIFELSNHPNRSYDWANKESYLHLRFAHIPYLRYKGLSEEEIEHLKSISKTNDIPKLGPDVNMSPLSLGHSMEDVFLEL
ncbi:MAG: hypothetical protein HFJ41_02685 [Clostridia bacterium]|nr:hypothetical protein [Clostridia bacterium]